MSTWPRTPLPAPVTAVQQLIAMCQWIDANFAQKRGGTVKPMESMWHVWEAIIAASDEPTVLVCCTGENPRGPFSEQDQWARVDRQWSVVIIRGHGFRNLLPDENGGPRSKENLTDSIEALRDTVRAMTGISEEFPVNYKGWKSLPAVARPGTANIFTAGAVLEFSTAVDIGQISEEV